MNAKTEAEELPMSEQEQCCGTCKWFQPAINKAAGRPFRSGPCCFELPPLPESIDVGRSHMFNTDGTTCPTFERREGA